MWREAVHEVVGLDWGVLVGETSGMMSRVGVGWEGQDRRAT